MALCNLRVACQKRRRLRVYSFVAMAIFKLYDSMIINFDALTVCDGETGEISACLASGMHLLNSDHTEYYSVKLNFFSIADKKYVTHVNETWLMSA